jgi:hypothetical protein
MSNTDNTNSNYYVAETSPGSGMNTIYIKDRTKFYKGLTYGFRLDLGDDMEDDLAEHLLEVLKPRMTYLDFDLGTELSVQDAVGEDHWNALGQEDRGYLSQFMLVKVGEAHIQLLPIS